MQTKSGEDTLHDTVVIAYQVLDNSQHNVLENDQECRESIVTQIKLEKRKRSYNPCRKKHHVERNLNLQRMVC